MGKPYWDTDLFNRSTGHRIRKIRELRGLTQKQLAEAVGCSLSMVQHIEAGREAPSLMLWSAMLDSMDFTLLLSPKESWNATVRHAEQQEAAAKEMN